MSTDTVLQRVQKLLALATSDNVHEAASAAAAAQALIRAHRLEGLLAAREEAVEVGVEVLERARRPRRWRGVLAAGLAPHHACVAYSAEVGAETELRVAGRPEDRAMVRALFEWLAPRLEWLSATHGAGKDRAWHEAFRVGAAEELLGRLGAAAPVAEHALLVVDRDHRRAAVDAWAERHLRLGKGRGLRLDARGYAKGQASAGGLVLPGGAGVVARPVGDR